MKTITVGSRGQCGGWITQIWNKVERLDDSGNVILDRDGVTRWQPRGENIRGKDLKLGPMVRIKRPEILWGTNSEIKSDIRRIIQVELGE